jgi:hypothetical protein
MNCWATLNNNMEGYTSREDSTKLKWSPHFVGVHCQLKLWKHLDENTCPPYLKHYPPLETEETVSHLYRTRASLLFGGYVFGIFTLDDFSRYNTCGLRGYHKLSKSVAELCHHSNIWRSTCQGPTPTPISSQLQVCFKRRFCIGWAGIQEQYFRNTNAKPHHNGLW